MGFILKFQQLCSVSVYQDDSSDELSEVLDDLLLPASDTEDIWQQDDQDEEDESEEDEEDDDSDDDQKVIILLNP